LPITPTAVRLGRKTEAFEIHDDIIRLETTVHITPGDTLTLR